MENSQLQGKTLYCCFEEFKEAFQIVPKHEHWKRIIEIKMILECNVVVAQLYKQVRCQLQLWIVVSQSTF